MGTRSETHGGDCRARVRDAWLRNALSSDSQQADSWSLLAGIFITSRRRWSAEKTTRASYGSRRRREGKGAPRTFGQGRLDPRGASRLSGALRESD